MEENDPKMWDAMKEMPNIPFPLNAVCFIMNLIFPGTGTMIASFFFGGCSKAMFLIGVFQSLTSVLILGWVWSIYWGYLICKASSSNRINEQGSVPLGNKDKPEEGPNIVQS